MKLIKPKLISGEIMTLIEEAEEKLIIISPYYNIGKWNKLLNTFKSLKNKKVAVEFYVRRKNPKISLYGRESIHLTSNCLILIIPV